MSPETIKEIKEYRTHIREGRSYCTCPGWLEAFKLDMVGHCKHTTALNIIINPRANGYLVYLGDAK